MFLGASLFIIKYGLDWLVATKFFGLNWNVLHYLHIVPSDYFSPSRSSYFLALLAMSLPFIWMGVRLTVQRLRDAGIPLWFTLFFFIPLLNLLCFLILCILGSAPERTDQTPGEEAETSTFLDSPLISATGAGVITALLILGAVALSTAGLRSYGVGLHHSQNPFARFGAHQECF